MPDHFQKIDPVALASIAFEHERKCFCYAAKTDCGKFVARLLDQWDLPFVESRYSSSKLQISYGCDITCGQYNRQLSRPSECEGYELATREDTDGTGIVDHKAALDWSTCYCALQVGCQTASCKVYVNYTPHNRKMYTLW